MRAFNFLTVLLEYSKGVVENIMSFVRNVLKEF